MGGRPFEVYLKHVMIDVETLGTGEAAVVASVAAVAFNASSVLEDGGFYSTLNWQEQLDSGGTVTEGTIRFWLKQPDAARNALTNGVGAHVTEALSALRAWFVKSGMSGKDFCVWAKGPQFDLALVRSLCRRFGVECPWTYWQERDVRTALMLSCAYEVGRPQGSDEHHAFDDAVFQAKQVQRFLVATGAEPLVKRRPETAAKRGTGDADAEDADLLS
jgi:exodeoxyribonuclease VIII